MFIITFMAGATAGSLVGIVMMCLMITGKREDEQIARLSEKKRTKSIHLLHFKDSKGKDLFTLPDGESIQLTCHAGDSQVCICRYLDEEHLLIDGKKWNLQEFAEAMEQRGIRYAPLGEY